LSVGDTLEAELGGQPPDGLSGLDGSERRAFAGILRNAKERQSRELDEALEESLGVVPRLLRGTVRKVLFG
jgi:hypothetical protein